MRTRTRLLAALAVVVTALAMAPSWATAGQSRVGVCHDGDNGFELITIAEPAYDNHLDHGDAVPGTAVPGQPDKVFDENCIPTDPPPPPTVDVCPNLEGAQETVPPGYELDLLRRCITVTVTDSVAVSNCRFDDATMTSGLADITLEVSVTGDEWASWRLVFTPAGPDPRFPPLSVLPFPASIGTRDDPTGEPFQVTILDFPWESTDQGPFIAYGDLSLFLGDGTQNDLTPGYPFRATIPQLCGGAPR